MKKIYTFLTLLFVGCQIGYSQYVKGSLIDSDGQPLSGITIFSKNSENKTVSDENGSFQIVLTQNCETLIFSGLHINSKEFEVCLGSNVELILERIQNHLDEVLIMGYSETTQRYLVGSVSKVQGKDIVGQPVGNPLLALHGRVPGMTVTSSSGLPGASVTIQVRGQNAIKPDQWGRHYTDPPLFIIDGIPFSPKNGNLNQFSSVVSPGSTENPYGGFSPFNSIDPQSIESIEVLKDADATAIYGSRGGNGVVIITTKSGKEGKTLIESKIEHGISRIGKTMPMMDTDTYLEMRREAFKNDGTEPDLSYWLNTFAPDLLIFDQKRNQDWKKYFLGNTAHNSQANLNISGGSQQTTFLIGGTYRRDSYIYPGDLADWRAAFNSSIRHRSNDNKLSLNLSMLYSYNKNTALSTTDVIGAYTRMPNYPDPVDEYGNLVWSYAGLDFTSATVHNPMAYLFHPYEIQNKMMNLGLHIDYKVSNNLVARVNMGYNSLASNEWSAYSKRGSTPFNHLIKRSAQFGVNEISGWVVEPQINYEAAISKGELSVLVGSSFQRDQNSAISIRTEGHLDDGLLKSISAAPTSSSGDSQGKYNFMAVFGRVSYIWNRQIIANVTVRRDGSSRFGPENRFGNFGSIGAGWIFADQHYNLDNNSLLSFGKIRGSWGSTGSDNTSPYQYISRWSPIMGAYNGSMGYAPKNLFNPDLGWARTNKMEFGLDLGFWQDRVFLNASWYQNQSRHQLINYTLPSQVGFGSIAMNWDAVVQNSGIELSLQSTIYKNRAFDWFVSGNISFPKNVLKKFDGIENSSYATTYVVGKPLNLLLGFEYAGVNTETGVFEYYDAEREKVAVPVFPSSGQFNDFVYLGDLDPRYYGGINNQISYKNWSLGVFIEFKSQQGVNFMGHVYSSNGAVGGPYNLPAIMEDRWRNPGDDARFMKVTMVSGSRNRTNQLFPRSSGAYGKASYARLKNTFLSWRLPSASNKNRKISDLSIMIAGHNLVTWSSYEGNDPETLNFYGVPPLRSIVIGLQAKF